MQADEQDILIWDSEIRRLAAGRGDDRSPPKKPAPAVQPANPVPTMTNPQGAIQRS